MSKTKRVETKGWAVLRGDIIVGNRIFDTEHNADAYLIKIVDEMSDTEILKHKWHVVPNATVVVEVPDKCG